MRYHEIQPRKPFKAQVRVADDNSLAEILTWANTHKKAHSNLSSSFGRDNVLSLDEVTLDEAKQLSPQDQQIKSLQQRAKQLTQQAKLKKAQQSVSKAQQQLTQATAPTSSQQ